MRRPSQVLAAVVAGGFAAAAAAAFVFASAPPSGAQTPDASSCASRTAPPPDAVVTLKDLKFNPSDVALPRAGMSICWQHQDGTAWHTITFDPPAKGDLDSHPSCNAQTGDGCFRQGDTTREVVFSTPGTFKYHCKVHAGMTGAVTVAGTVPTAATTSTTRAGGTATTAGSTDTTIGTLTTAETTTTVAETTTSQSTTSTLGLTTQTTSGSALGGDGDDDKPSGTIQAVAVLLLAAATAALIPAWRRLT